MGSVMGGGRVLLWSMAAATGILIVAVAAVAVYSVRGLLVQMLVAVFLAVSLDPLVRWMIGRGVKRRQAVALIFLLAGAFVVALIWAFGPALMRETADLGANLPDAVVSLRTSSPGLRELESRLDLDIAAWLRTVPQQLSAQAFDLVRSAFGAVLSVLLVVVMTAYLMLDLPRLRRGLVRLFPKRHRPGVSNVINLTLEKVGSYMIANVLISLVAGVTALIALLALGVPFALPLALLVALTDLIPLIGATLGAAVCLVVAATSTDLWPRTVLLGLFFLIYQQVENYVIVPRMIRGSVDVSSLAVLFAALIGASLLGIVGALMAVPIAAALKVVVADRLHLRDDAAESPDDAVEEATG